MARGFTVMSADLLIGFIEPMVKLADAVTYVECDQGEPLS
jgi:hypothetical protein